ncbi:MAG TPA: multidrug effflux MFS transporter [Lautropia sp.]|nr:multidrug effflux MFS transporter [Lautropia sp.]
MTTPEQQGKPELPPNLSVRRLSLLVASLTAIGPFAIDTYLPAFDMMAQSLGATQVELQQTLSIYLLLFGVMNLWHGAISDALGRRVVLLTGLALFTVGCAGAALSATIHELWFWRAVQGAAGGVGMAVGRAVVRDVAGGAEAQRILARTMMLFALAPAIAPVIGGFIATWFGWRAIFVFIALLTAAIFVSTWMLLPETLPKSRRQGLRPRDLLGAYYGFLVSAGFWRLGGALAANFQGFFLFILAAPVLLTVHLKLAPTEYAWLFVPATAGTVLGGFIASRSAGRKSLDWAIRTGYLIMGVAAACNLLLNLHGTAQLPWAVLPIMLYTTGMGIAASSLQVRLLDLAPDRMGMASSCQAFVQSVGNALSAAVLAPLLWGSTLRMALGMAILLGLGALLYALHVRASDRATIAQG